MKIAMFMLFFVCNMFTILIMRFAYESNYRYNNGMLIGVHIPGDHVNDDDVTRLMTRFKKSMKYFQNINAVLSIAICFLNFVNIIIFVNMVAWNVDSDKHSVVVSVVGFICKSHDQDCEHVAYEE